MTKRVAKPRVLFASSEAAPVARVGGLAEAAAGLTRSLRRTGEIDLTIVLPDYGGVVLSDERRRALDVPKWVGKASIRSGIAPELGAVTLISVPGIARPNPYVDADGQGWPDNDRRFFGFSAAVAALAVEDEYDLVHLNDWHTSTALATCELPSVFTIHTLGYQGHADLAWAKKFRGKRAATFDRGEYFNPVAGAVQLADAVVAVSPSYVDEIVTPYRGEGLHKELLERGEDLVGICNGIDTELWDPSTDPHIATNYSRTSLAAKADNTQTLRSVAGWSDDDRFVVGMVTRMVDQKGIDLLLSLLPYLDDIGVQLFVLGTGDERLTRWARELAAQHPGLLHYVEAYDVAMAHQIFAGADFLAMPSRFEPCGLAQMQAMRYGTIPIVTPVGGLRDTVVDADADPENGNGFVAKTMDVAGMVDALHRAIAAGRSTGRGQRIQKQGMATDWSWEDPKQRYLELYERVLSKRTS